MLTNDEKICLDVYEFVRLHREIEEKISVGNYINITPGIMNAAWSEGLDNARTVLKLAITDMAKSIIKGDDIRCALIGTWGEDVVRKGQYALICEMAKQLKQVGLGHAR